MSQISIRDNVYDLQKKHNIYKFSILFTVPRYD